MIVVEEGRSLKKMHGFSLLEVSIVLLIMGMLLSSVLQPFGAQMAERQRNQTKTEMLEIRSALVGYVAANHRFPCPLTRVSGSNGDCSRVHGFVPAAALGVDGSYNDDGLLIDSWGQPYLYSVSNGDADADGTADFTSVGGMQRAGMQLLSGEFEICDTAASCSRLRANQVAVVLVSTGSKMSARSNDERENSDGDNRFVSRDIDQVGDDQFDDMVVWLSESVLFAQLIQARVLP